MFLPCEYEYTQESLQKLPANVTKELNLSLHPQVLKKGLKNLFTFFFQRTLIDAGMVIESLFKQVEHRATAAGLLIFCAIADLLHPGIDDSPRAHGAGFQSHIQRTSMKPPAPCALTGIPDGLQLRVGSGVSVHLPAVTAPADDLPVPHDHTPYRHIPVTGRLFGQF